MMSLNELRIASHCRLLRRWAKWWRMQRSCLTAPAITPPMALLSSLTATRHVEVSFEEIRLSVTRYACVVMLTINGKSIPNAPPKDPPHKFNLSFANSPSVNQTEYNLFVNNLPPDLDDAGLYQVIALVMKLKVQFPLFICRYSASDTFPVAALKSIATMKDARAMPASYASPIRRNNSAHWWK